MNTKRLFLILTVLVVIVGGFFLLTRKDRSVSPNSVLSNIEDQTAPAAENFFELQLKDYDNNTVLLSDFKGNPLVINSWAAWCPFCKQEIPDFVSAQKEFGDKVTIIAINRSEAAEVAKVYTDQQETTKDLIFLLDPSDSFYQSIGGFSMPETIFVDKNGNIVFHKRGPMDLQEIENKIQLLLSS